MWYTLLPTREEGTPSPKKCDVALITISFILHFHLCICFQTTTFFAHLDGLANESDDEEEEDDDED